MDTQQVASKWSIEIVGGVVCAISLIPLLIDDEPALTEMPEVALPLVAGGGVVAFGRWLHHKDPIPFDASQRGLVAVGHLAGGVLFVVVAGWILQIVGLESGFPDEIFTILLNGAAIGLFGGGVLAAVYLRLRHQHGVLQSQTAQLEVQNERLEKLASIVSHDLRSPLNVAQGRLELAEETGDTEHLAAVDRALTRMDKIIANMLALTRQTHTLNATAPVALNAVAESAWQTVEAPGITLEVEDSVRIEANEDRLRQVFENLFRNALEHGGESLTTVRVGALDPDGFYVEDDGGGISEADREKVFEWGVAVSSSGTGLGLAIIKEIVEAHDWKIVATEGVAGGARFEITGVRAV